ncbi:MAG TPA: plastocyanin/azurin family copper-binding protein [Thermoanaerobaculia bacterium]|jgi:plastocyanin
MLEHPRHRLSLAIALLALCGVAAPSLGQPAPHSHFQVIVPQEDRFTPFAQTIHAGDTVKWINKDTDDHTVVSDDTFNTTGHQGLNVVLKGTDSNGGKPGVLTLHFPLPGTFVYYCRFHAHLDADHQPAAPGPKNGIQDPSGNYGTPMMGIITVLP